MGYLLLVSLIWAFSFGLIKNRLAGLDPTAVAAVRIAFSLLIFLPLLRVRGLSRSQIFQLILIGAVEFGVMYLLYLKAYAYLNAYEVALFTVTTPLYLAGLDALLARRLQLGHWVAAILAVAAGSVIIWHSQPSPGFWHGLILLQISNLCFAAGQLAYRRIRKSMTKVKDAQIFGWLYVGALAATALSSGLAQSWAHFQPSLAQWEVLAYLGILSSGLCFFWWNRGALSVNAGTLAALNNAKMPLAVACSLLFFHESADLPRLFIGGVCLLAAVGVAERASAGNAA